MTQGQQGQQGQQNPTTFLAGSAPRESCGKVLSSRPQLSPRRELTLDGLLSFEQLKGSLKNSLTGRSGFRRSVRQPAAGSGACAGGASRGRPENPSAQAALDARNSACQQQLDTAPHAGRSRSFAGRPEESTDAP